LEKLSEGGFKYEPAKKEAPLIIDLVVSSVLISIGILMIPPQIISLPFKLMLFVLASGWEFVILSLVRSYQ